MIHEETLLDAIISLFLRLITFCVPFSTGSKHRIRDSEVFNRNKLTPHALYVQIT